MSNQTVNPKNTNNSKVGEKVFSSDDELESGGFTERLAYLISESKNITALAKSSNMSLSGLQRLAAGGMPTLPRLISIARAGKVSVEWLATGEGEMYRDSSKTSRLKPHREITDTLGCSVDLDEFYFIPRYDLNASAGHGAMVDNESHRETMAFRKSWVDNTLQVNPKGLAVLGVKGDSMDPEINNKDVVLINTYDNSLRDGIYVLRFDNDLIVKRIQKLLAGTIEIISANPVYKTMTLHTSSLPEDFGVIGRVLWFGRTMP